MEQQVTTRDPDLDEAENDKPAPTAVADDSPSDGPAVAELPSGESAVDGPPPGESAVEEPAPGGGSTVDVPAPGGGSTVDVPAPGDGSTVDVPVAGDWPRTAGLDRPLFPDTPIVFRRPAAQFVPGSAHPDWFNEDTAEQEPIEQEGDRDGTDPSPVGAARMHPPGAVPYFGQQRKRRRWSAGRSIMVAALVALTAAGATTVAMRYQSGPVSSAGTGVEARPASNFPTLAGSPPVPVATSSLIATAPLTDVRDREFDLVTATSAVTVTAANLGDRLFVATTPAGGNSLPSAEVGASRVALQLVPSGKRGVGAVEIKLNSRVRWHLRLSGGAVEHLIDMSAGRLSGIDINGGATHIELSLPAPNGTIPIQMTGGANQFLLHLPPGVPVRVRVRSGASSVNIDQLNRSSIAPGTLFTPAGWDGAANRYDIDAVAGFATLRLDRV